jgi:transmembrane sensor
MQKDYKNIPFEELIRDESFRDWVIFHDTEKTVFWEKWMIDNPDAKSNILLAKSFLENLEYNDIEVSDDEIEGIVETIIREEKTKFKLWKHKLFRMAASVLLVLGISIFIYKLIFDDDILSPTSSLSIVDAERMVENTNKTNHVVSLYLEDGSKIQLYPKSSVKYPNPFDAKKREVFLNGKAFFDVAKNAEKPFWVHTHKISTRVLGTSFMVSYFEGDKKAKVQVNTGKVSVYTQKDTERPEKQDYLLRAGVVLTPNQQVLFDTDENRLTKSIVEEPVQITTAEKFNFKFEEVPLKDVLAILEKSYGISFNYDEKKIQNCYITANIEKESLYEKLNLICRITNSTYEVVDAQVIIFSKGCD